LVTVDATLPVRLVHASRGKGARAEPVAALFEARRCLFAGTFPELEDELTAITVNGVEGRSPDRADAMVWAITELIIRAAAEPRVRGL
jgi:phage terminase large subunit-like protein